MNNPFWENKCGDCLFWNHIKTDSKGSITCKDFLGEDKVDDPACCCFTDNKMEVKI